MKEKLKDKSKYIYSFDKKKNYKFKKIILTCSNGYDLPFLQYTQLGLGNLILTYLYALHIKSLTKKLEIISFYPIRIIPIIKDLKYWYLRSSFEFNYKLNHLKRFFYFFLLGKTFKNSFIENENLFLSTHIVNTDTFSYKKISNLNLNYIKKNIIPFLNFNYKIKSNNKINIINDKNKYITLGLHLRRGDFIHKGRKDFQNKKKINDSRNNSNTSPNLIDQINIINKIKSKIKIINIYSDQSHLETIREIDNKLNKFKLKLFPVNVNGSDVLEDMMKNDVIILSNSTLSITSCILSNQLALFKNQLLPKKIKKYFKNIKEIKD